MRPAARIRRFRAGDAVAVALLHRRAVLAVSDAHYSRSERESWAAGIDPRAYLRIAAGAETFVVAEMAHGPVGGFCSYRAHPGGTGQIMGLYVDPMFQRQGLASALLDHAETELATGRFMIHASVSALAFYTVHGYRETERLTHETRGGKQIDMRVMRKDSHGGP